MRANGEEGDARRLDVMVTGGTGFVGLHTVLALVDAGHRVRLLVRNPDKLRRVFGPFGLADLPFVEGDITDESAVSRALDGCDAIVHAAAMVSLEAHESDRVLETNLRGTRLVLGGGFERGIDRMVQVSSTTALFRPGAKRVDERSPLGDTRSGYGRSKIECDRYVRELQSEGAPIYTTYPGMVIGPHDPGLSEGMAGLRALLDVGGLPETTTGIQLVDVRDLGLAHVGLLERGGPPDRYTLGGHYLSWPAYGDLIEEVVGRSIWRVKTPPAAYRLFGQLADVVARWVPLDVPMTAEASRYATEWVEADDGHIQRTLGLELRSAHESVYDAVFWLQGTGHLRRRYRLAR